MAGVEGVAKVGLQRAHAARPPVMMTTAASAHTIDDMSGRALDTAMANYGSGNGRVFSARMRASVRMISATVSQCSSASRTPTLGDFVLTCLLIPAIC